MTFNLSGKKLIKSIQARILSLKHKLSKLAEKIHKQRVNMPIPAHIRED